MMVKWKRLLAHVYRLITMQNLMRLIRLSIGDLDIVIGAKLPRLYNCHLVL